MGKWTLKESAQALAAKGVLNYLDKDPDRNIPKILDWIDRFDADDQWLPQRRMARTFLTDSDSNWYKLVKSLWTDIDDGVRRKLFENFILNAALLGVPRQQALAEQYGCNIPWAILMDPTSACNLHCTDCWAAEYGSRLNLTYEEMDDIVNQANDLGCYMFLFTGGEPLVRKKDILRLCEEHNDCVFLSFTNATLIDEEFADAMLRVKNFVPAISVEGFEQATDDRRGQGTYQAVIRAMEILRRKRLPFGISCCYTSANTEVIGSEAYFDDMIAKGAKFAWFFTYMPCGQAAVPELMATAQQREFMYHQIRRFRQTKPLFTLDFWNDGEYVEGCIAGGRRYFHINANGDIEACAFIHYSDSNIREHTLLEALRRPFFQAYHDNQPWNGNHLRPCPVLDNPGRLTAVVEATGAHSTDLEHPEDVRDFSDRCVSRATEWAVTAERLWAESGHDCSHCAGCGIQKQGEETNIHCN